MRRSVPPLPSLDPGPGPTTECPAGCAVRLPSAAAAARQRAEHPASGPAASGPGLAAAPAGRDGAAVVSMAAQGAARGAPGPALAMRPNDPGGWE